MFKDSRLLTSFLGSSDLDSVKTMASKYQRRTYSVKQARHFSYPRYQSNLSGTWHDSLAELVGNVDNVCLHISADSDTAMYDLVGRVGVSNIICL